MRPRFAYSILSSAFIVIHFDSSNDFNELSIVSDKKSFMCSPVQPTKL